MFSAAGSHSWNLSFDFDRFSWFAIIILFVILDILLVAVSGLTCIIRCICS